MTEAEIVAELSTRTELLWNLVQWWASISIALIAVSHVASERINGVILVVLLACYTLYSYTISTALAGQSSYITAIAVALRDLSEQSTLGPIGANALDDLRTTNRGTVIRSMAILLFVATFCYPIYEFVIQRRAKSRHDT